MNHEVTIVDAVQTQHSSALKENIQEITFNVVRDSSIAWESKKLKSAQWSHPPLTIGRGSVALTAIIMMLLEIQSWGLTIRRSAYPFGAL